MANQYNEEISRTKPSCIIFLIDQSGSMSEKFGGVVEGVQNPTKADGAADALNRCLSNLTIRCAKGDKIRDYFSIAAWGYGESVGSAFSGALTERKLYSISTINDEPSRIEDRTQLVPDGSGGIVEQSRKFPVWIDAKSQNGTPMCQAFKEIKELVGPWMNEHPNSYPPTIINITDGASTDGDPVLIARELMQMANANGSPLLLFNIHLCAMNLTPILYPVDVKSIPDDQFARALFESSSLLPEKLVSEASTGGLAVGPGSRGYVFNAGLVDLIRFLDIGTKMATTQTEITTV